MYVSPDTVATGRVRLSDLATVTPLDGACVHEIAGDACALCTPVQAPTALVGARKAPRKRKAPTAPVVLAPDAVRRATARATAPLPDATVRPVRAVPAQAHGSLDPVMQRVDAPSERRTRDALPDSVWHGVAQVTRQPTAPGSLSSSRTMTGVTPYGRRNAP